MAKKKPLKTPQDLINWATEGVKGLVEDNYIMTHMTLGESHAYICGQLHKLIGTTDPDDLDEDNEHYDPANMLNDVRRDVEILIEHLGVDTKIKDL